MPAKNYYSILKVKQTASQDEIKRSYRRLALIYHPDKNNGDTIAEEVFKEIKEAYNILSDHTKRTVYDRECLHVSTHINVTAKERSAKDVVDMATQLHDKLSKLNAFKINYDALLFRLHEIVSGGNMSILKKHTDKILKERFLEIILMCSQPLPVKYANEITEALMQFANDDGSLQQKIASFKKVHSRTHFIENNKIILAIISALVLCILIWFIFK